MVREEFETGKLRIEFSIRIAKGMESALFRTKPIIIILVNIH